MFATFTLEEHRKAIEHNTFLLIHGNAEEKRWAEFAARHEATLQLYKAVSDAVMGGATREKAIEKLRSFQGTQTSPDDYWYEYYGRIIEALEKLPAD